MLCDAILCLTLTKVLWCSLREPSALEGTDAADIMLGGKDELVVHDSLPLLSKQRRRRVNAHRQAAAEDTLVGAIGLEQSRVLEEACQEALEDNLEIMATRFLGIHPSAFAELDQLFPHIHDMAHMARIDKIVPAPVPVALHGLVRAQGVEQSEMISIERGKLLAGFVGLLAFGGWGREDSVD